MANLPMDSAVYASTLDLPPGWTLTEFLLTDLYRALTGEEHPARPKPAIGGAKASAKTDLVAKLRAQRERLAASEPNP